MKLLLLLQILNPFTATFIVVMLSCFKASAHLEIIQHYLDFQNVWLR